MELGNLVMANELSQEAVRRKERSESLLAEQGIPINRGLPKLPVASEVNPRPVEEIAYRVLCLLPIAGRGCGLDPADEKQIIDDYDLIDHFTPKERAYLNDPSPSEPTKINFNWRFEAAWVLLWALGYIDEELSKPTSICDVQRAYGIVFDRDREQFIADARPLPISKILDEADLIYRYNWATNEARLRGREAPSGLNNSVIVERHYALNWLVYDEFQDWDDVEIDT